MRLYLEMDLKKLHMGTISYGHDSMDEVIHQLAVAFGASTDPSKFPYTKKTVMILNTS